jgi:YD repeat-containing protein
MRNSLRPESRNTAYDLANRMTQVSDATGTYGFSYDNMGRLTGTSTQYSFLQGNTYTKYSNQRLKCGLSQDENCKKALEQCIKLGLTNPFPPPWWLKDLINWANPNPKPQPPQPALKP